MEEFLSIYFLVTIVSFSNKANRTDRLNLSRSYTDIKNKKQTVFAIDELCTKNVLGSLVGYPGLAHLQWPL